MLCVIHKHMNLTSYYKTFSQKEHVFFYDFHEKKKQYKKTGSLLEITGLPAVFVRRIGVTKPQVQLGVGKNTLV